MEGLEQPNGGRNSQEAALPHLTSWRYVGHVNVSKTKRLLAGFDVAPPQDTD